MIALDLPREAAAQHAINLSSLRSFLARAQKTVPLAGEVSVLLTSDREIRRLNRTFRGKDKPTDVLSFPAPAFAEDPSAPLRAGLAGDLAISVETAARQAKQFGHPLQDELKILLLHGLLHLAGHDHESDDGEMAAMEDALRRRFRLPGALIARATPMRHAGKPAARGNAKHISHKGGRR